MVYVMFMKKIIYAMLLSVSPAFSEEPAGSDSTFVERYNKKEPEGKKSGFGYRFFTPSARIYFDSGTDDPGEIDIFNDGSVSATINILEFILRRPANDFFQPSGDDRIYWGPALGFGITTPARDSDDGAVEASDAPVFLISAGLFVEIALSGDDKRSIILEGGYTTGFSTDEGLSDNSDGAFYVGLGFNF
jgi:hypothetical protein